MKKEKKIELFEKVDTFGILFIAVSLVIGFLVNYFFQIRDLYFLSFLGLILIITLLLTIINIYEFFHLKNKLRDIYFKNNPKMKFWLTKIIAMLIILLYILVFVLRK